VSSNRNRAVGTVIPSRLRTIKLFAVFTVVTVLLLAAALRRLRGMTLLSGVPPDTG
jgi:hypothetical protein